MNLIIGTSQLSKYFPKDYKIILSRNIDFDYLKNNQWDSVYITFAEQRRYEPNIDFITPNYIYTLDIINSLIHNSNKICCYGSSELWNQLSGCININNPPSYISDNDYIKSKILLIEKIKELRQINPIYNKVILIHPMWFNSVGRCKSFLFGKIFDSIINKNQVKVGNINFLRDMVHTSFVCKKSIEATQDIMVGSGKLFNVREFIQDLYKLNGLDFNYYVKENLSIGQSVQPKFEPGVADVPWNYTYQDLLNDTQNDIKQFKVK